MALAEDWLSENRAEPFFLWLHFFDSHDPYQPPEPYKSSYSREPYKGEIASTDACIGRLMKKMIDVFPTIMGIMGLAKAGEAYGQGTNLMPWLEKRTASPPDLRLYCETLYTHLNFGWSQLKGMRDGEWKYIQAPKPELYQVSLDPAESRNFITAEPRLAEDWHDLLREMEQTMAAMKAGEKEKARAMPSEEVRLRLESLGYICAPREAPSGDKPPDDKPPVDPKDMVPVLKSIDRAQKLYAKGEIRPAIEQFEEVLVHDTENMFIHYLLGDLYRQVEDYGQAVGHYLVVVKEQEDYLEMQYTTSRPLSFSPAWWKSSMSWAGIIWP